MTMTSNPVDNGVNSAALLDARNALSQAPAAAEFTWRSTTTWMHGTYSRSTVEGFSGLGQDHVHKSTFTFDADHPRRLRFRRSWCHARRDRPVRAGQLPHRRRRRRGTEPRHPAAVRHGHHRGRR